MTLTAFVFPKLRTVKTCLDKCLKSPISENPSTSNMINASKHCPNLRYININWSLPYQLSWKKFLLLTWKILGLLVSTSSTDEKCPVVKRDKLTIPIQMDYLRNKKVFHDFLLHFSNLAEILNVLKQKTTLIAFVFPKLRTPKT